MPGLRYNAKETWLLQPLSSELHLSPSVLQSKGQMLRSIPVVTSKTWNGARGKVGRHFSFMWLWTALLTEAGSRKVRGFFSQQLWHSKKNSQTQLYFSSVTAKLFHVAIEFFSKLLLRTSSCNLPVFSFFLPLDFLFFKHSFDPNVFNLVSCLLIPITLFQFIGTKDSHCSLDQEIPILKAQSKIKPICNPLNLKFPDSYVRISESNTLSI